MKKTDLATLTVAGLKALAKKKNVKLPKGAVKSDIAALLRKSPVKGSAAVASASAIKPARSKKAAVKKAAKKKSVARKAVSKKVAPLKAAPRKAVVKKSATKKAATKKAAGKKAAGKKTAVKKTVLAKTPLLGLQAVAQKDVPERTTPKRTEHNALSSRSIAKPSGRRTWIIPKEVELPLRAQEQVADAKYYTGLELDRSAMMRSSDQLSAQYGEDRITLMARDPSMTYAYWEVTTDRLGREKAWFGMNAELVVRIYDITGVQFDGRNATGYFDQAVEELTGSWYFETGRPGHSFCADIGLRSPEGRFLTLARSNYITMPRDGVSDVIDEEWMLADETFWQLYGFPDGISSPQVQELWRRRHQQEISSPGLFSRTKGKIK